MSCVAAPKRTVSRSQGSGGHCRMMRAIRVLAVWCTTPRWAQSRGGAPTSCSRRTTSDGSSPAVIMESPSASPVVQPEREAEIDDPLVVLGVSGHEDDIARDRNAGNHRVYPSDGLAG